MASLNQINANLAGLGQAAIQAGSAGASGYWNAAGQQDAAKIGANSAWRLQQAQLRQASEQNALNRAMQERLAQVQLQGQIRPVEITTAGQMNRQIQNQQFATGMLNSMFGSGGFLGPFLQNLGITNLLGNVGAGFSGQPFTQTTPQGFPQYTPQLAQQVSNPNMFTRIDQQGRTYQEPRSGVSAASTQLSPLEKAMQQAQAMGLVKNA